MLTAWQPDNTKMLGLIVTTATQHAHWSIELNRALREHTLKHVFNEHLYYAYGVTLLFITLLNTLYVNEWAKC